MTRPYPPPCLPGRWGLWGGVGEATAAGDGDLQGAKGRLSREGQEKVKVH